MIWKRKGNRRGHAIGIKKNKGKKERAEKYLYRDDI
jgi:hypothetical protein